MLKLIRTPDSPDSLEYKTSERRYSVVLSASLCLGVQLKTVRARVCNISEGGMMATVMNSVSVGADLSIDIDGCQLLWGQVVWVDGAKVGIKFSQSIDPLAYLADRCISIYGKSKSGLARSVYFNYYNSCLAESSKELFERNRLSMDSLYLIHNDNYKNKIY